MGTGSACVGGVEGAGPLPASDGADLDDPGGRKALGRALRRRAPEVGEAVVESWRRRFISRGVSLNVLSGVVTYTSTLGTELVGRYLEVGEGATPEEAQRLAERSTRVVVNQFEMSESVKNYLTWRDQTLRVVREEAGRLGVAREVVAETSAIVRASADVSMIRMVKEFDVQRRDLQRTLEQERAKLTHLALHDPLTGLANRMLLLDRLSHAIAGTARRTEQVGVLYLDLDGFKGINDTLGHQAGDRLLVAVADRLQGLVRPSDTVARLGGDEFVIVCNDLLAGEQALGAFAERIRAGVAAHRADVEDIPVSVSIGGTIAVLGDEPEHVLARADAEMYVAKQRLSREGRAEATLRRQADDAAALADSMRTDEQPDA
jgi:diguanylate cyclase (GGDEF)-like protein